MLLLYCNAARFTLAAYQKNNQCASFLALNCCHKSSKLNIYECVNRWHWWGGRLSVWGPLPVGGRVQAETLVQDTPSGALPHQRPSHKTFWTYFYIYVFFPSFRYFQVSQLGWILPTAHICFQWTGLRVAISSQDDLLSVKSKSRKQFALECFSEFAPVRRDLKGGEANAEKRVRHQQKSGYEPLSPVLRWQTTDRV